MTAPEQERSTSLEQPINPVQADEFALEAFLLTYEEACAAGLTPSGFAAPGKGTPCESLPEEVDQARICLELLHRRWPWPAASARLDSASSPALTGSLGRYQVQQFRGAGGHGLVFLAYDPSLHRRVALKVPRPEAMVSPQLRARFLREARALARLAHPGIVPIHDFGEDGAICYLATAFIDGPNLADWLACQPSPPEPRWAARLVLKLAEAVAHAHERGVLHRDLKPANVLLDWDRADGESEPSPRITDFGLARLLSEMSDETLTRTGAFPMGTPGFAAPEQARGEQKEIGAATDVYSLGAILHAILTAYSQEGPAEQSGSARFDERLFPMAIRAIVARCLRHDPRDRYPTAAALAADLRRFLHDQPVTAGRLGRGPIRRGWDSLRSSHRIATVAFALSIALPVAGLVFWASRTPSPKKFAATQETFVAAPLESEVRDELDRTRYIRDMQRSSHLIRESYNGLNLAAERLDRWAGPFEPGKTDPRGFEWGYLKNFGRRESMTLRHRAQLDGKPSAIYSVRFSSDGKRLISAGMDGFARIWDSATGSPDCALEHVGTEVNSAVFSPDGVEAATADDKGLIRLWNVAQRAVVHVMKHGRAGEEVVAVLFTPDGRRLVSGGRDHNLVVWDAASGQELARTDALIGVIETLAMDRAGKFVVAGGGAPHIVAILELDGADHSVRHITHSSEGITLGIDVSPDGHRIAVATSSDLLLIDASGLSEERQSQDLHNSAYSVAFARRGSVLVSGGGDGDPSVRVWETSSRQKPEILPGHTSRVWGLTVAPDGKRIASASQDGTIKLWNLDRLRNRTIVPYAGGTAPVAFGVSSGPLWQAGENPHGLALLVLGSDGTLHAASSTSGHDREVCRVVAPFNSPHILIAPDGGTVIFVSADGSVAMVDLLGGRPPVMVADARLDPLRPWPCFDQTSRFLAMSDGLTHDLVVVEAATGRVVRRQQCRDRGKLVCNFVFLPGERGLVASEFPSKSTVVWDFNRNTLLGNPNPGAEGYIWSVALSPDGKFVATGDEAHIIQIRDTHLLRLRATLRGHDADVDYLTFSPDSQRLASLDRAGTVKLWDVVTGEELFELDRRSGRCHLLQFAPDGDTLVVAMTASDSSPSFTLWHGGSHPVKPAGPTP